jgi:hypothetical protein
MVIEGVVVRALIQLGVVCLGHCVVILVFLLALGCCAVEAGGNLLSHEGASGH